MEVIQDFEDILRFLEERQTRYLIIGGLAFIFHAKPRYTKDIDIWIEPSSENIARANEALAAFGAPSRLSLDKPTEIMQIGVSPNRIDFLFEVEGLSFEDAWLKRVRSYYGHVMANWIDLDSLIQIKSQIDALRHQEDARVLRQVKEMRSGKRT